MRTKDATKATRILDAAAAIILKQGAAAVSTVKVAKKVGIAQSNVYLYFKNKDALLHAVYQREQARIRESGDLSQLADQQVPVQQRLRLYLQSLYDFALAHPDSLTLIQQVKFLLGHDIVFDEAPGNVVVALLQEAIDAKVIKAVPVNIHMALVFGVIYAHTLNVQHGSYAATTYDFETFYQLIWQGMATPSQQNA
jgi:AcrR family transcriptional regulator